MEERRRRGFEGEEEKGDIPWTWAEQKLARQAQQREEIVQELAWFEVDFSAEAPAEVVNEQMGLGESG